MDLQGLDGFLQSLNATTAESGDLAHIFRRQSVQEVISLLTVTRHGACCHGEPHILGPVDQFQNRTRGLIVRLSFPHGIFVALGDVVILEFLLRFDSEYTRVAAWAFLVAFAEGPEEFGDDGMGFLSGMLADDSCIFPETNIFLDRRYREGGSGG